MPTLDDIRQGGTPFDPFLYATVGLDRNDNAVTMLSTLARLGLEPWEAAFELASMTRAEALSRLGALLARFGDVPALQDDHAAITHRLIALLPQAGPARPGQRFAAPLARAGALAQVAGALIFAFLALRALFTGSGSTGE